MLGSRSDEEEEDEVEREGEEDEVVLPRRSRSKAPAVQTDNCSAGEVASGSDSCQMRRWIEERREEEGRRDVSISDLGKGIIGIM